MPKAFNETEREKIKAKLLEAGRRLITRYGVRRLVVDDVVGEAGISKGSFYLFFPSREEFILSVLEALESEYRRELVRRAEEGGGTAPERMERFFLGAFELFEREPGLAQLGSKDIGILIDRLPPERLAAHQAEDERELDGIMRRWIAAGLISKGCEDAFRGLMAAVFSISMHREDFPPGSYGPTIRLIAEALAMKVAARTLEEGRNGA